MSAGSTAAGILGAIESANGYVTLALEAAGVLVPIVKGVITEIKKLVDPTGTVTYQLLIQTDQAALTTVLTLSEADLAAINAELAKMGLPPASA